MPRSLPLLALALTACGGASPGADAGEADAGVDAGTRPLSKDGGQSEIIDAHNAVRLRAMPAPSPALPLMSWSDDAAAVAAAWADGCKFVHNPALSGAYGENLFAASGGTWTPTAVVESWASEASKYDYANNRCSATCGHYTQVVWRASVGVGCASKTCTTNSPFGSGSWVLWVCDYAPAGNIVGQRPY